jgi:hypothetical protein
MRPNNKLGVSEFAPDHSFGKCDRAVVLLQEVRRTDSIKDDGMV